MGGKAIKAAHGIETVRLEKADYEKFLGWFLSDKSNVHPVLAYSSKEDFGDADIVHSNKGVITYFNSLDWPQVSNGNVLSIGVPLTYLDRPSEFFQVDMIYIDKDKVPFALGYFGFNDLGNLIGRVAHRMGLKFGHDGLWLTIREDDHLIENILVTLDYNAALKFLGYEPHNGFDTIEDIFRYVITSPYFARDMFPLEHRNTKARMRDRKRPTYTKFLSWLGANPEIPDGAHAMPRDASPERKHAPFWVMQELVKSFPEVGPKIFDAQARRSLHRSNREKFNGRLVSELTNLYGKELGVFIADFKNYIGAEIFPYYIAKTQEKEIRLDVAFFFTNQHFPSLLAAGRVGNFK